MPYISTGTSNATNLCHLEPADNMIVSSTEKRADTYAIDKVIDDIDIEHTNIYIIHSDFLEGANHFKKCFIEKGVPEENIHINYISSVIAVHTGLGCIALQYIRKEN